MHFCSLDNQEKLPYLTLEYSHYRVNHFSFSSFFVPSKFSPFFVSMNQEREGKNKLMHTFFKTMNFVKKKIYCKEHCNVLHIETDFGEICFNIT